jgi:hypothetical protein
MLCVTAGRTMPMIDRSYIYVVIDTAKNNFRKTEYKVTNSVSGDSWVKLKRGEYLFVAHIVPQNAGVAVVRVSEVHHKSFRIHRQAPFHCLWRCLHIVCETVCAWFVK